MSSCNVKAWSSRSCSRGTRGCVAQHKDDPVTASHSVEEVMTDTDRKRLDEAHSRKAAFDDDVLDDGPSANDDGDFDLEGDD